MVFSSPIFLFGFLPITLLFYYLSPRQIKNITLLSFSLLFYAWGEVFYLGIMLVSIISNYFVGLKIQKHQNEINNRSKYILMIGVIINLALLVSFKYANFITDNINIVLSFFSISEIDLNPIHLPLGISFFTFQALSYIIDVYRKEVDAQNNIFNLALYISLFPQLIAGPIVRYHDISNQISHREHSIKMISSGIQRFIYGLAKKMLIANSLGEVADSVFSLSSQELTMPLALIGILAYTLQIYFDFSGYSDMAIGLGRIFGFTFLENFNYPYISSSLREFWKRWHISLSTWFRDYLYIPLGGSRVSPVRVYLNLLIVFVVTGFWHGASWNFLIWGLFHGIFLTAEHSGLLRFLEKMNKPIQHIYLLTVVIIGWVFFRAETLPLAIDYIQSLFGFNEIQTSYYQFAQILSNESIIAFCVGLVLVTPIYPNLKNKMMTISNTYSINTLYTIELPRFVILVGLFYLSALKIASSSYNPFIYFRF